MNKMRLTEGKSSEAPGTTGYASGESATFEQSSNRIRNAYNDQYILLTFSSHISPGQYRC